jgi:methyl-accepting chemotaxis protein
MAAIAEEKNEGLDPVTVDAYADHLMKAAEASDLLDKSMSANTEEAKEIADEVARYTMKMNKGVEKLANGFEEWNSILNDSNEASEEYYKAMTDIKDAMSDVLGVDEEFLTDSFIKDHLPLIKEAAEGSAEAIDELAAAAA